MKREAVSCIIFSADRQKVLLIKRRDIPVWVLPGGGIEPGEMPVEAAKREAEEETGFKIQVIRQTAKYWPINRFTQPTYAFECIVIGGQAQTGFETKGIDFFSFDHLPKELPPFFCDWIEDALQNVSEVVEKPILGTSYWMFLKYLFTHPILVIRFLLTKIGFHLND
jgi:8-oxo-dGTP pyrophosphatase MutT (NUDIX family)